MKFLSSLKSLSDPENLRAKAREHKQTADLFNDMAANGYLERNNKRSSKFKFDLHGLYVAEAEEFVHDRVSTWLADRYHPKLTFICGKGNNSPDGQPRILPAIEALLKESHPELRLEVSDARIVVSIDRLKHQDDMVDLREKLKSLPFKATASYPCFLNDDNAEQAYAVFRDLTTHCGEYLAKTWKHGSDAIVRAVELSEKFGLKTPLNDLLVDGHLGQNCITDDNVEELAMLCKMYSLNDILSDCEQYIRDNWKSRPEKALLAVEIADKLKLSHLADEFIPVAATRQLEEIGRFRGKLSSRSYDRMIKYFDQFLDDEKIEEGAKLAFETKSERLKVACEDFVLANWKCPEKVVGAVKLCAKYGLHNCLGALLRDTSGKLCNVSDANLEPLLNLCKTYPQLAAVQADCLQYVVEAWSDRPEKAFLVLEIAHEVQSEALAKVFIPLAACRPADELEAAESKLSAEYCWRISSERLKLLLGGGLPKSSEMPRQQSADGQANNLDNQMRVL